MSSIVGQNLSSTVNSALGALDAVEAALDPAKAKVVDGIAREVARQDGGSSPSKETYSKPARMPYSGE